jgi:CheY-like chemotaxis protein/tetratricopeptide (TPR) repeat protein
MSLQSQLAALQQQTRGLTLVERAKLCCGLAKQFEKAGEYEAACEALVEFWPEREGPPKLEELDEPTKAEVLLRIGALAGWLGSTSQTEGSQETAKNLITRSIEIFEDLGQASGVAEAHADLALCYWREGAFDEARINLAEALSRLKSEDSDLKACVLIRSGMVERRSGRLIEALRCYEESAPLVEQSTEHALKGSFHNSFGAVLSRLAGAENREDYLDRALIEYAAASFHFEQTGHVRYRARVENNLGYLLIAVSRFNEVYVHLDRARGLFLELGDVGAAAGVYETRARALLTEGRVGEAERVVRSAVKTLERGGEQALLAEALTTQGIVLARLGKYPRSKELLDRAIEVAETAGDLEGAGRAKLSIIEELAEQTSSPELASIYQSAADLLQRSQDPSAGKRLISCARKVIDALGAAETGEDSKVQEQSWEGFSFKEEVLKSEGAIIERALRDAGGSVTRAARLLGFKHHQSLISLINSRHKELLKTRSAVRQRRRHLFSKSRKIKRKIVRHGPERATSQICILHVENNKHIAKLVGEMFPADEWLVELCTDGDSALRKLTGKDHYDLLLVDSDLPGLSGLDLVQRARKITHRRRTPIVMLSGSNCETAAWKAGVDAFLGRPEQISELPSTISRLLQA